MAGLTRKSNRATRSTGPGLGDNSTPSRVRVRAGNGLTRSSEKGLASMLIKGILPGVGSSSEARTRRMQFKSRFCCLDPAPTDRAATAAALRGDAARGIGAPACLGQETIDGQKAVCGQS